MDSLLISRYALISHKNEIKIVPYEFLAYLSFDTSHSYETRRMWLLFQLISFHLRKRFTCFLLLLRFFVAQLIIAQINFGINSFMATSNTCINGSLVRH